MKIEVVDQAINLRDLSQPLLAKIGDGFAVPLMMGQSDNRPDVALKSQLKSRDVASTSQSEQGMIRRRQPLT